MNLFYLKHDLSYEFAQKIDTQQFLSVKPVSIIDHDNLFWKSCIFIYF